MLSNSYDYIIAGAGLAGCVLADRLSASGRDHVLLFEAGPADTHPFVHMPKGIAKLFGDPKHAWFFTTEADGDMPTPLAQHGLDPHPLERPEAPAVIRPKYLSDPYDQDATVAMFRMLRRWVGQPALDGVIGQEVAPPGPTVETDQDIIRAFRTRGGAGYHACGTARMGGEEAVLDDRLNVRGVSNLRVVDGSIMPMMVSANTNGPIMAIGWRAVELITQARNR